MTGFVGALRQSLGDAAVLTGASMASYLTEWRGNYDSDAIAIALPGSTQDVVSIVRAAAEHGVSLVPQGGNTGLVGGAVATDTQCIVNLQRMNTVHHVDAQNFSMHVDAGCTLAQVRNEAAAANRLFALDVTSAGSCQIGGNVSTNAGGVNVLRYGCAREQVLGLEVVTADGRVLQLGRALRKNTAGYDLKQLFIGAEGTLGIITAVHLKLFSRPPCATVLWLTTLDAANAVSLYSELREQLGDDISAFELIPEIALQFVTTHMPDARRPVTHAGQHVLIELHGVEPDAPRLQGLLGAALQRGDLRDAVVASDARQTQALWSLRHHISDAQRYEGVSIKHDIAVPISSLSTFITSTERAVAEEVPGIRPVVFGHVGDGNLHFNCSQPTSMSAAAFRRRATAISHVIHSAAIACGGTVSAEHGIGIHKRDWMRKQVGSDAYEMMCIVKRALDPNNMLNPGKVL
ncbi:MAG: FAD-binding oxidoreductase [Pseudomonadota bacterium]